MGIEHVKGRVRNEGDRDVDTHTFFFSFFCVFFVPFSSHLFSSHLFFCFNCRYLIPGRFVPSEYPLDDFFKFMVYLSDLGQWEKYA